MFGSCRARALLVTLVVQSAAAQQIWDVWQTTWNKSNLFKSNKRFPPIEFKSAGPGPVNIAVDDSQVYQPVVGFGGTLTDSSALLFSNLKVRFRSSIFAWVPNFDRLVGHVGSYWTLINYLFSPIEDANAAGLSYIRVPLGASAFSANRWSFNDVDGDICLNDFNFESAPPHLFEVLADIKSVNSMLKVHLVPWSPPAWMKTSGSMNGGALNPDYMELWIQRKIGNYGVRDRSPTARFTVPAEAQVGRFLKELMLGNGFENTKLIGFEHNWDHAGTYPVQLMQAAGEAFDGVAFHCYGGSVAQQAVFSQAFPDKEIYFTECTGKQGSDYWTDLKSYMNNIFIGNVLCLTYGGGRPADVVIPFLLRTDTNPFRNPWILESESEGSINQNARAALMYNLALDGKGEPRIPGTDSCGAPGCRGIVTINPDGTWKANQEFYAMAQASKGTIPRDMNGPGARRMGVQVVGNMGWTIRVGAFVTGRTNPVDWLRYSLVVLNRNDSVGGWNPQSVNTTIEFRGKRATFTFPLGVTTLWWYAPAPASTNNYVEA